MYVCIINSLVKKFLHLKITLRRKVCLTLCAIMLVGQISSTHLKKKRDVAADLEMIFPSTTNTPDAVALAKQQSVNAFEFLKDPGTKALEVLKKAATNLVKLNYDDLQKNIRIAGNTNRDQFFGVFQDSLKGFQKTSLLHLSEGKKTTSMDHAGAVALCGDLVGCVADSKAKCVSDIKAGIAEAANIETVFQNIPSTRGGSTIAPNKKKERALIAKNTDITKTFKMNANDFKGKGIMASPARLGVLNQSGSQTVQPLAWPYQAVPKKFVEIEKAEPFAGHFSGSCGEMIFGLDYFGNYDAKSGKNGSDGHKNPCTAALTVATLIGAGYHSAIEVVPCVRMYMGDGISSAADFKNYIYSTTATDAENTAAAAKLKGATDYIDALYAKCKK